MATLLTQTYNLNLIPGQNIVVVNVSAYDNSPRLIRFNMYNGSAAIDVSAWAARVEGTRQFTDSGFSTTATVSGSTVTFAITNEMTASSGRHPAVVVFYQGEDRVASADFVINVSKAVMDESVPATEEDNTLYQQWIAANTAQIQQNATDIAVLSSRMDTFAQLPPGSTSGDAELIDIRVGANGTTYPTAGDAVRGQVSDLKTALSDTADDINSIILNDYELTTLTPSATSNHYELTGTGLCAYTAGYKMTKYTVSAGDLVYIKASKDGRGTYQFQKSTGVPSSGSNVNLIGQPVNTNVNRIVEVPENATCLIVSSLETNTSNIVARAIAPDASDAIDKLFVGADNIIIANRNTEYTATSSSTWQGGYQINMDYVPSYDAKTITAKAEAANGYGKQLITFVFYSDAEKQTQLKRFDIASDTFNIYLESKTSIPDNTAVITIRSALISNDFSEDHTPSAGDVAYLYGLNIWVGGVSLSSFVDVPRINEIDPSAIYTLNPAWAAKIQSIQDNQNGSFTFAVQTDTHYGAIGTGIYKDQYNDLMNNLSKFTEYVGFDFICNLGDIIRGYEYDTTDDMRIALTDLMHRYVTNLHCPLLVTPGNHDTNLMYAEAQNDPSLQIMKPELYSRIIPFVINSAPDAVFNGRSLYYYVDFESADIRVIMLNTTDGYITSEAIGSTYTFSAEQVDWFTNVALNTTKKVIFMCHVPLVSELTTSSVTNGAAVLNALKAWKQNGGDLIGCFYGHTHAQTYAVVDGILHVTFTNGGYCTEIVMIDTENKIINTIGIGTDTQGNSVNDRTFSY